MGYYTKYSLEIKNADDYNHNRIIDDVRQDDICQCALNQYGETSEGVKNYMYQIEKQISKVSLEYPEALFILTGIGEEYSDFHKTYIQNGKNYTVTGEVAYPEFNQRLLKEGDFQYVR